MINLTKRKETRREYFWALHTHRERRERGTGPVPKMSQNTEKVLCVSVKVQQKYM